MAGRSPSRAADRWESGVQESAPFAIQDYVAELPNAVTAYQTPATQTAMNTAYTNSETRRKANYASKMTAAKAGEAYKQRMEQIAQTGFTTYQKQTFADTVEIKQHLETLLPTIVTSLTNAATGEPTFKGSSLPDDVKKVIANIVTMAVSGYMTTASDAAAVIAKIKSEITNSPFSKYLEPKS